MRRFALVLALVVIVSILGVGVVTAQQEDNVQVEKEADLAVNVTLADSEGNPLNEAAVGDEVVGVVQAANNGPDNATGVIVSLWQQGFGKPEVENIVNWWSVSWDGVNWVNSDPSFDPKDGVWYIGNMSAGDVYTLLIGFTAKETGPGVLGAMIEGNQYDPDYSNNQDEYIIDIVESVTPVSAGEVPMQPTGAPLTLAILSILMTIAGFTIPKIK